GYNSALHACHKASWWQQALDLQDFPVEKDVFSVSTSISVFQDAGRWDSALRLLQDASSEALELNIVVYGAAAACVRRRWRDTVVCLGEAMRRGLQVSLVAQNNVLAACEDAERWEKALSLLEEGQRQHLRPGVVVMSSAASACSWEWPQACGLLEKVITATGRGECWSSALCTLQQAVDRKLAQKRSFRAAMAAVSSSPEGWQVALALLATLLDSAPAPDLECFNEA
ncbi:unnamed protein product, partial [Effrenium voratum]